MKKKPTQREHFQQSSYLSAGCFEKWNRNQQHSENTSNKAGIYLLGVLPRKYSITVYNLFSF